MLEAVVVLNRNRNIAWRTTFSWVCGGKGVASEKFFSPLKLGLFIVALAYFLFALHDSFTLSWIGEWNRIAGGAFRFEIYFEDVVGFVATFFRLAAGIIAFAAITIYFAKRSLPKPTVYKVARSIVVLEGLYWVLAFLPSGYFEVRDLFFTHAFGHLSPMSVLNSFTLNTLPVLVESIATPIVLFVLAYKLNPNKPLRAGIRWGLIYGTVYVFVLWLLNTTLWVTVINEPGKGTGYLTSYPQNLLSFLLTALGLLALTVYTGAFAVKSRAAESMQELNLKSVGVIILSLGLYFLWNYLTWIYFGGWSDWYAWFLGHNEDLWILSLPMLGIPLLFSRKPRENGASL